MYDSTQWHCIQCWGEGVIATDRGSDSWRLLLSPPPPVPTLMSSSLSPHHHHHQQLQQHQETAIINVQEWRILCEWDFLVLVFCAGKEDLQGRGWRETLGTFARNFRHRLCKKFKSYRHFLTSCWCRGITRLCTEGQTHDLKRGAVHSTKQVNCTQFKKYKRMTNVWTTKIYLTHVTSADQSEPQSQE